MTHTLRRALDYLGSHINLVLVVVLLIVGGSTVFVYIADEVMEGETQHFDNWAVRALRRPDNPAVAIGPPWLAEVGRDITALGGVAVMTLVTAGVAGYLLLVRKFRAAALVVVATLGALLISSALKHGFARQRPELVPHLSRVYTSSFPSGHSMLSSAVYLTLGSLLARLVPQRRVKIYFLAVALFLTFIIGLSRVYMGVHYPTDVLAGWTAGLVWALICWLAARYLQRRGKVEKDTEQTDDLPAESNLTPTR
jgi:undecaprenyl-diphosphatase